VIARWRAYDHSMSYLLLAALIGGLLMYLLCSNSKAAEIGRMLFFAAVLGLLIALGPSTVHVLHGG
jgi:DMSO reductase anchor subunit